MPNEIERKYLPKDPAWRPRGKSNRIVQGYFWLGETVDACIRVDAPCMFKLVLDIKGNTEPWQIALPQTDGTELYEATQGKALTGKWTLRVRDSASKGGEFCLKGKTVGISRPEYEYPLSARDTKDLLRLCPNTHILKHRYERRFKGFTWEIDVYENALPDEPPVMIEVELPTDTTQPPLPSWVGQEVSHVTDYANAALARRRWEAANPQSRLLAAQD